MIDDNLKNKIENLGNVSPLDLPQALVDIELYEQETAKEMMDRIHADFQKEDIVNNVVTPVFTTMIDGVLAHPRFKRIASKTGLSAQRVMRECKDFNYDGKIVSLMPDAFVEYRNEKDYQELWGKDNRSVYIRSVYENTSAMNRYKKSKVSENGAKKNLQDEYRMTNDTTPEKNNPDGRRKDPLNLHNTETDHIVPLHTVFNQLQNNSALSDGDIKRIANQDYNFAVTARLVNNPKRDMSNSEFIAEQDKLKAEGKPYVELSPEVRANMIKMEQEAQKAINRSVNKTVVNNLLGKGQADRKERKAAMENREKELGRKLTLEERATVDRELAQKKAMDIHMGNAAQAGKQSLMYAIGTAVLFVFKPLYYEIKDGIIAGFKEGVCADTYKEAFTIRFNRVKEYVWGQLKDLKKVLGSAMDMLKNFLSALIEGLIGMFVGIFKKLFKVLKEGVRVFIQAWPILFGEQSKTMTASQKGDAILKLVAGSVVALCGIGIDALLEKVPAIPEDLRGVMSVFLSGLTSVLVFYALDKADLFNVKEERRNQRIKELFDERINDIREATDNMNHKVTEVLRNQQLEIMKTTTKLNEAIALGNYNMAYDALIQQAHYLGVSLQYNSIDEIQRNRRTLNWDL